MTDAMRAGRLWWSRALGQLDWSLELLVVLLVAAESAVLFLVAEGLLGSLEVTDRTISPVWLFLLLYLGTTIQRAMDAHRFFSPEYEIVSAVSVVALLLAAVRVIAFPHYGLADPGWLPDAARGLAFLRTTAARPVWGIVVLVGYAWYRGRTRDDPSVEAAYRLLRVGTVVSVLALLVTMALVPTDRDPALRRALYAATTAFLACTLGAITLGRLRIEQARGALTLTPRWLITFLGPVAVLVLVGTLVAGIFTRRFLETIVWLLTPVFRLLDLLVLILVYVATGLAWVIFTVVSFLIDLLGPNEPLPRPTPTTTIGTPQQDPFEGVRGLDYPDSVRYLLALALLALLVFALTRFLWHRRPRRLSAAGEERESVFSWGALAAGLGGLLAGLGGRFGRRPDPLDALRGDPRWRHTLAIRETYRQLLQRGAAARHPRGTDQTPDEYAPVVAAAGPPAGAVGALTGRYDGARYSDQPATAEDAAAARAAWEAIERAPFGEKGKG